MTTLWEDFKEQIREAVDFPSLVAETVPLRRSPNGHKPVMVRCPWHDDHTPSLAVYADHATCYGACGQTWDVFGWAMKAWGVDFVTARDRLAERYHIPKPHWTPEQEKAALLRRQVEDVLALAACYWQDRLWSPEGAAVLDYARGRGWTDETIRKAGLGASGGDLASYLQAQGVDLSSKGAKAALNMPAGMLVYVHRRAGRVEYVSGRLASTTDKDHRNPPSDLAGPRRPYYNYTYTATAPAVVLVEGQADAVTLAQWDIPAVALAGCGGLPDRDLAAIKRHATIYITLDTDEAGRQGTHRLAEALGPLVRIITLPDGVTDVNAWAQQGASAEDFQALLDAAPTWLDLRIGEAARARGAEWDDRLREVVGLYAQLDTFTQARYKSRILEELNVGARDLAAMTHAVGSKQDHAPLYAVRGGQICRLRGFGGNGTPQYEALCNFQARITEEIVKDDGQDVRIWLAVQGQLNNGAPLPEATIEAEKFNNMSWVTGVWGARAIVNAGMSVKDHLRAAIQTLSQEGLSRRVVYTHTGWRVLNGQRVYLSHGGALGAEGVIVEIEDKELTAYQLPQIPQNPQEAMRASLRFLEIAPYPVTIPVWAAMFLSPLSEILPPGFILWIYGKTGTMKTSLAAQALCHYGSFAYDRVPATWGDTENKLEKRAFIVKDAPLLVDDFAPQDTQSGAIQQERKAQRLVRSWGNRSARGRLRSDLSDRTSYLPRGLVMATGEDLPKGQSILARLFAVEVIPTDVDKVRLSAGQAEAERYAHAMAGYLLWLADQWDHLAEYLPQTWRELRDKAMAEAGHLRIPAAVSALYIGLDLALAYAVEVGALNEVEAADLRKAGWEALIELGQAQKDLVHDEDSAEGFLAVLRDLLAQGKVYLAPREGEQDTSHEDGAEMLGWYDENWAYLLPEAAYNRVASFCRRAGGVFPLGKKALYKSLRDAKVLVPTGKKSTTPLRTTDGLQRVIRLKKSAIVGGNP